MTYARQQRRKSERVLVDGRLIHHRAPHGRPTGYTNYGCRCAPCSEAWNERVKSHREQRQALLVPDAFGFMVTTADVRHGSKATYDNWGCRCRPCTDAKSAYTRDRRSGVAS